MKIEAIDPNDPRLHMEPRHPPMVCRRCRQALSDHDQYEGDTYVGTVWFHPSELTGWPDPATADGHAPDPVPLSEMSAVSVCDFCPAPVAMREYPCETFTVAVSEAVDGSSIGHGFTGGWAACEQCAAAIDAEAWQTLEMRMRIGKPTDTEALMFVGLILAGFRSHRTGPGVPLT